MAARAERADDDGVLPVALAAALLATPIGVGSAAVGPTVPAVVNPHWAGYVATGLAGMPSVFTRVTGTWRHPRASCTRTGHTSAAAIWVGVGGYDRSTQQLQQ